MTTTTTTTAVDRLAVECGERQLLGNADTVIGHADDQRASLDAGHPMTRRLDDERAAAIAAIDKARQIIVPGKAKKRPRLKALIAYNKAVDYSMTVRLAHSRTPDLPPAGAHGGPF